MILCNYGCNQEGLYQLKNGKYCCSDSTNKCPELKRIRSIGLSKAHKENPNMNAHIKNSGKMNGWESGGRNNTGNKYEISIDEIVIENSLYGNEYIKERIFHDNLIPYNKCIICGIENWMGKNISLELDHINGNHTDNRLENLRFLCPNCHSQTDTFRGRNTNIGKIKVTDEELLAALKENSNNISTTLKSVELSGGPGNYKRIQKLITTKLIVNNLIMINNI